MGDAGISRAGGGCQMCNERLNARDGARGCLSNGRVGVGLGVELMPRGRDGPLAAEHCNAGDVEHWQARKGAIHCLGQEVMGIPGKRCAAQSMQTRRGKHPSSLYLHGSRPLYYCCFHTCAGVAEGLPAAARHVSCLGHQGLAAAQNQRDLLRAPLAGRPAAGRWVQGPIWAGSAWWL